MDMPYNMYSGTKARTAYGSLDHQQLPPPRQGQAGPAARVFERRPVPDYYQDLNGSDDDSDDSENFRRRRVYMSSDDEDKEPEIPRRRRKPTARVPPLTPADLRISPAMKAEMEAEQKRSSTKRSSKTLEHLTQERRPSASLPYSPPPSTFERTESRRAEKTRAKPKPPSRRNTAEKVADSTGGSAPNVSLGSQSFMKEVTRNVLGERFTRRSSSGGSIRGGSYGKSTGG
jgi:hypothetical protein